MNTFGHSIRLTSFGESHGKAIGGVIDGIAAGIRIDTNKIQAELNARRPGQSPLTSPRNEKDQVEILSGIANGQTLGSPIGFVIWNKNQQKSDYEKIKNVYRPGHADFSYAQKYGIEPQSGGGRASARETAARVVAGAICEQFLCSRIKNIKIISGVSQVHDLQISEQAQKNFEAGLKTNHQSQNEIYQSPTRFLDFKLAEKVEKKILKMKQDGDSVGGVIKTVITGLGAGLGEPVFGKLEAELAKAMMSLPASKGFSVGLGFGAAAMKGSENNDHFFCTENGETKTITNNSGGTLGGISTGAPLVFDVAFKPPSTINKPQQTVSTTGQNTIIKNINGRHDPCVLPRAVPIVRAMAWLVLADAYVANLVQKTT